MWLYIRTAMESIQCLMMTGSVNSVRSSNRTEGICDVKCVHSREEWWKRVCIQSMTVWSKRCTRAIMSITINIWLAGFIRTLQASYYLTIRIFSRKERSSRILWISQCINLNSQKKNRRKKKKAMKRNCIMTGIRFRMYWLIRRFRTRTMCWRVKISGYIWVALFGYLNCSSKMTRSTLESIDWITLIRRDFSCLAISATPGVNEYYDDRIWSKCVMFTREMPNLFPCGVC